MKEYLDLFLNFIFLGKGVTIQTNIGRKASRYKGNGMIMSTMGRDRKSTRLNSSHPYVSGGSLNEDLV